MTGGAILLRKELLESWRTLRLPIVAGLFLLVGLTSPLLAKFLPEIVKAAGGDQLGNLIQIPTPVAADAVDQLWKNLAQFGAFAAIILAMGAVATERDRGTAAFVLSKTVDARRVPGGEGRRPSGAVLGLSRRSWPSSVAWIYTAILFEPRPVGGWIALAILAWLGLRAWAAHHVPRQHGDRARPRRRPGSASWRCSCCRSSRRSRTSAGSCRAAWPARRIALATGAPVDAADVPDPGRSRPVRPDRARAWSCVAAWSFRRQEICEPPAATAVR